MESVGWVAEGPDGLYDAHVEFGEGPFDGMQGPSAVAIGAAVGWARQHAGRIVLRIGNEQFSAGRVRKPSLPPWEGDATFDPPDRDAQRYVSWEVLSTCSWLDASRAALVAEQLGRELRADGAHGGAETEAVEEHLEVRMRVDAADALHANEVASIALRRAWSRLPRRFTLEGGWDCASTDVTRRRPR